MIGALMFLIADDSVMAQWRPRTVACIERNHRLNESGHEVLRQYILWHQYEHGLHVRAWCLDKDVTCLPQGSQWVLTVWRGDQVYVFRGERFRETWTNFDPEVDDRELLSRDERMGW